ncbi:DUF4115 domain-containing protein, partial [Sphingomonas bacterium]|uniref:DUF4115 domain-containing protein n=1 Tax=Sphingomonas bacterium TaxID=1895847 RepID=UPI00157648AF
AERYEPYEPADPARTPSRLLAFSMLGLALLVALGYLYWRGTVAGENPAAIAVQSASQPAAPSVATPAPAAASMTPVPEAGATALLTAEQPVWLRVSDGDSKLFEGMLEPGDHYAVPATATDPRLRTSRATVLKVTVGSASIPPLGPPETLIKNISLTPQALLAHAGAAPQGSPSPAL